MMNRFIGSSSTTSTRSCTIIRSRRSGGATGPLCSIQAKSYRKPRRQGFPANRPALTRINGRPPPLAILRPLTSRLASMSALPPRFPLSSAPPAACRPSRPPSTRRRRRHVGFKNDTNARNFAGLNFDPKTMADGIRYAHGKAARCCSPSTPFPRPAGRRLAPRRRRRRRPGVDAIILADVGLLDYARRRHPGSACTSRCRGRRRATKAINFAHREFGVRRAVLPRVLTLAQVEHVIRNTPVEIEVFGFGSLCVMNEGRCWLSSYACGESPTPSAPVRRPNTSSGTSSRAPWRPASTASLSTASATTSRPATDPVGAASKSRETLLRPGRADQPQRPFHPARHRQNRRPRHQGRRPPAQPGLRHPGHPHPARRPRRPGQRRRALPRQAQLAGRTGWVSEGNQATLGAYNRPWR